MTHSADESDTVAANFDYTLSHIKLYTYTRMNVFLYRQLIFTGLTTRSL
jgi:hypothetical protein